MDFELERFLHLYCMNRGILLTPFHNMALMAPQTASDDVDQFTREALEEIAHFAFRVNEGTENIGARRTHTIMERVLDEISFSAPEKKGERVSIDADYVRKMLADIVKDQDLSRYIL